MYRSVVDDYLAIFCAFWTNPVTRQVLRIMLWGHMILFVCLFFLSTVGKKFGFRKKYIIFLDRIFDFVAQRLIIDAVPEEDLSEVFLQNQEVIISPETPLVKKSPETAGSFNLGDALPYIREGMQSIIDDKVNKSFSPQELTTWNVLSRTRRRHKSKAKSVTSIWICGVVLRYLFLVPVRLVILSISMTTMITLTLVVGRLPEGHFKKKLNAFVVCWSFDFVASSLSVVARFHDKENRPRKGVAVANHTSPIDSMVLATDNCYDMVGQVAGGFLGFFMTALSKSSAHIWFNRTCSRQRNGVTRQLECHAKDSSLPPVLIYPEGTCVNNTSILMFRKGVFELDVEIYPIAIKFDPRYGDAFWHENCFFAYCFSMMTSWAIVCDVWYLPPMRKFDNESSQNFANRVKSAIAKKVGLREIDWDGFIRVIENDKFMKTEKEKTWLRKQQQEFARHLKIQEESSVTI